MLKWICLKFFLVSSFSSFWVHCMISWPCHNLQFQPDVPLPTSWSLLIVSMWHTLGQCFWDFCNGGKYHRHHKCSKLHYRPLSPHQKSSMCTWWSPAHSFPTSSSHIPSPYLDWSSCKSPHIDGFATIPQTVLQLSWLLLWAQTTGFGNNFQVKHFPSGSRDNKSNTMIGGVTSFWPSSIKTYGNTNHCFIIIVSDTFFEYCLVSCLSSVVLLIDLVLPPHGPCLGLLHGRTRMKVTHWVACWTVHTT